jgi:hypothetical protein
MANLVSNGWGEPVYILLMMFSITINYVNGILIEKYRAAKKKAKLILVLNIVINLALLGFFKYYDLIVETLSLLPFIDISPLGLGLPIGISFYTFQTMSYPLDVYRGDAEVQKNFISFGTFVALFPQLIAGPIVRYKDISDQLASGITALRSLLPVSGALPSGLQKRCSLLTISVFFGTPMPLSAPRSLPSSVPGSALLRFLSKFILIFPGIRIWPSGLAGCSDSNSWKTLITPIFPAV